jgi:hypothetical protein
MTPWKHAESSAMKWGGSPIDYIHIHDWLDETKQFTGDWTHRALRHHSAGVQWAIRRFGHTVKTSDGKLIPTKMVVELHIEEDCGFIPTVAHYLEPLRNNPIEWMLMVKVKTTNMIPIVEEEE